MCDHENPRGVPAAGAAGGRWAARLMTTGVAAIAMAAGFACGGQETSPRSGSAPADAGIDGAVSQVEAGAGDVGQGEGGGGAEGGGPGIGANPIIVSIASLRPRTTTWSINYWQWSPTYGDDVTGTAPLVAPLATAVMRVGGYNNDANTPDPFDHTQLDTAIAYAHAIGAEPLLQVPHLADVDGGAPTAATGAEMVTYANVTQHYGVKYFSVGNEPDLYATQGSVTDMTEPAIPGYTPEDYCTSARSYVTAMKAVDPTIQIVGPDLAYQYQVNADWLTPILQSCGDVFDIVSIHRYPFSSLQATIPSAAADAATFRTAIAYVRSLMQAAGYGDKPLALTEMNVAYDATPAGAMPGAAPGTVPSALWLGDILGAAIESNLWTSAVWNISDTNEWSLGLIGLPPSHTPRPEYYAYALYADHFGPTLADVTASPTGVAAHASRNVANDATEVIVVNWNSAAAPVAIEVTGLATAVTSPVYELPALSITAVEVPDVGTSSSASTYGSSQHDAVTGPQPLAPMNGFVLVAGAAVDAGGGATSCATVALPVATIASLGRVTGTGVSFGPLSDVWSSYVYGGPGQSLPSVSLSSDGLGFQVAAQLVDPAPSNDYVGMGLYYSSASCADVSTYSGFQFDLSGNLGACTMVFGLVDSGDLSVMNDPIRGVCPSTSVCYGPATSISPSATGTIQVPFSELGGGMPVGVLDATTVVSAQWQLTAPLGPPDAGGCNATFAIENAAFY